MAENPITGMGQPIEDVSSSTPIARADSTTEMYVTTKPVILGQIGEETVRVMFVLTQWASLVSRELLDTLRVKKQVPPIQTGRFPFLPTIFGALWPTERVRMSVKLGRHRFRTIYYSCDKISMKGHEILIGSGALEGREVQVLHQLRQVLIRRARAGVLTPRGDVFDFIEEPVDTIPPVILNARERPTEDQLMVSVYALALIDGCLVRAYLCPLCLSNYINEDIIQSLPRSATWQLIRNSESDPISISADGLPIKGLVTLTLDIQHVSVEGVFGIISRASIGHMDLTFGKDTVMHPTSELMKIQWTAYCLRYSN